MRCPLSNVDVLLDIFERVLDRLLVVVAMVDPVLSSTSGSFAGWVIAFVRLRELGSA